MTRDAGTESRRSRREPGPWRPLARDLAELLGAALLAGLAFGLLVTAAAVALPAPVAGREGTPGLGTASPLDATSGSLLMRRSTAEGWTQTPTLDTEVGIRVSGVVARAHVVQRFRNGTDGWVEGVYVFPLPEGAAVDHLRMRVGERVIEGQIRERQQAREEYRRARASGRRAALLDQERPNVFTTSVSSIGPGEELVVEIELQETLSFGDGEVRLRFPLVVGPRYIPGVPLTDRGEERGFAPDTDRVPDASRITPPVLPATEPPGNPVRIEVELDAGFPVQRVFSRYHPVVVDRRSAERFDVRLREDLVPADRDFELAWTPRPGTMPRSAVFEERRDGTTYALLTLFPPSGPDVDSARLPREVVFAIDTSGSMEGPSIRQAREALLLAIDRLHAGDRFNVIRFDSTTRRLFPEARLLTAGSRQSAREFVEGLRASGGTEMAPALEAALVGGDEPGWVRQVVFLTDGSVGDEDRLFDIIRERLGDARLFTVGIGSAPNAHFMTKAAEFGHGTFTWVGDVREVEERMNRLLSSLESPVLTGIEVHWPLDGAVESYPQRVPDLYLGEPIVLSARLDGSVGSVTVTGWRAGEPWQVDLPLEGGRAGEGPGVVWARSKVRSLLDSVHDGADPGEVRAAVVGVGLEHHLVTRFTSLVAVDVTPARPADESLRSCALPTNLPYGWSHEAVFGELPQTGTEAPVHGLLAMVAGLAGLLAGWPWRSRGRAARVSTGRHA
jgi:Ca-activated chloride channel family protein